MASLEELAAGLRSFVEKAEAVEQMLRQAGELADGAISEFSSATAGASRHEQDAHEVVALWTRGREQAAELADVVSDLRARIDEYIGSLMGDAETPQAESARLSWVERTRSVLPKYVTSGIHRDQDGFFDLVQSGRDSSGEHINRHLKGLGVAPPIGGIAAAEHVEIKVAWRMRTEGIKNVELVVNNDICSGVFSCTQLLPFVLAPGQTLVVHDPLGSQAFRGREVR